MYRLSRITKCPISLSALQSIIQLEPHFEEAREVVSICIRAKLLFFDGGPSLPRDLHLALQIRKLVRNVKVKLTLRLFKHHAMKTYGEVEV
jgi:hypothetical protein